MLEENNLRDIKRALQSTFGVTTYDDIKQLTTGLSNAYVLRIVVQGKPYLLKIARTDTLSDPTLYYYTCMKAAADAGIAPRVVTATGKQIDIEAIAQHDFWDFHNRMWTGEIDLAVDEHRLEYALVHLEQFRRNLQTKAFEEALKIVSNGNPD